MKLDTAQFFDFNDIHGHVIKSKPTEHFWESGEYKMNEVSSIIDPIDYVTGIGNAHSNQYKIFAHSALWCWSSSPRSELENSVSWTAEVRLS